MCYDRGAPLFSEVSSISELIIPLRAPESVSILHPRNFVPENGFPVVKELRPLPKKAGLEKNKTDTG